MEIAVSVQEVAMMGARAGFASMALAMLVLGTSGLSCQSSGSDSLEQGTREYYVRLLLVDSLSFYGYAAGQFVVDANYAGMVGDASAGVNQACFEAESLSSSRDRDAFLEACDKYRRLHASVWSRRYAGASEIHPWKDAGTIIDEMNASLLGK